VKSIVVKLKWWHQLTSYWQLTAFSKENCIKTLFTVRHVITLTKPTWQKAKIHRSTSRQSNTMANDELSRHSITYWMACCNASRSYGNTPQNRNPFVINSNGNYYYCFHFFCSTKFYQRTFTAILQTESVEVALKMVLLLQNSLRNSPTFAQQLRTNLKYDFTPKLMSCVIHIMWHVRNSANDVLSTHKSFPISYMLLNEHTYKS